MSEGKRLENMTWRLWHRAYSRRAMILPPHPTTTSNGSDLRIPSALPLSPSLSFSSSSEVTSNSSGWDRDTAVNDEEEASFNGNSRNGGIPTSSITPCLGSEELAPYTSPPTMASPVTPLSTQPSHQHLFGHDNNVSEVPARLPVIPSNNQDFDRDNSQLQRHPLQSFCSSEKANIRNATGNCSSPL